MGDKGVKSTFKRTIARGAYQVTHFFGISHLPGTEVEGDDDEDENRLPSSPKEDTPYWMKDDYWNKTNFAAPSAPAFDDV